MKHNKKNNQTLYFIGGSLLVVVLLISLTFMNKKGTYSLGETNLALTITCPEKAIIGGEVTCDINLVNPDNETIYSINANYDLPSELIYVSYEDATVCTGNNCFETLTKTQNGFAVINTTGVSTSTKVGELTLSVDNDANVNEEYTIGLTNIEFCDDEYEMQSAEDAEATITIESNIATLSDITLEEQVVSEVYNPLGKTYVATVEDDVDTVTLVLTKDDEYSTITGNTEDISLHYGTNSFTITVTSEDETETNEYTITIFREYDFDTSVYLYDETANYIYTKNDSGATIISNLEEAPQNISYSINNGSLEIRYLDNELLKGINIYNFATSYTIVDSDIYISNNNTTLAQLKSNITSTNLTIKVFDDDDLEVTNNNETIDEDYQVKIYSNETLLDTYDVKLEYINIDESLIIDAQNSIIERIPIDTTFGELKAKITSSGTISIETDDTVTDDYILKTGDVLKITLNNEEITYTISVLGCLDNNPSVGMSDIILIYRYMRGRVELSPEKVAAADIINDGQIGLNDVIRLYLYHKNKVNTLEVN